MFLKKIDFLSPKLTLHFFNLYSHSTIISGIFTLITYSLYIIAFTYFLFEFILRKNATSFFYNRIIDDAGTFLMNESMFHYLKVLEINPKLTNIQIIGIPNILLSDYNKDGKRENYDHYIYSFCKKDIKNNLSKNISDFIDDSIFYNTTYCIESFYNSTTKIITKYNEKNFTYPLIKYDMSNLNAIFYGIIVQKCINSTLNNNSCDTSENIKREINGVHFEFHLINYNVDIKNYNNPLIHSFISINSGFSPNNFTANHLIFQPLKIISHDGLIFNSINEKSAYKFEQNEKQTWDSISGILGVYYLWMQNNAMIYERNYKKMQNFLSDFGGLTQTIYMITYSLNYLFYKFTLLNDINKLLSHISNFKKNRIIKHNINIDGIPNSSSIINLNLNNINKNSNRIIQKNNIAYDYKNKYIFENNSSFKINNNNVNNNSIFEFKKIYYFKNIKFCSFIKWMFQCSQSKSITLKRLYYIYDTYRKIISEESLFYFTYFMKEMNKSKNFDFSKYYEKSLIFV